MDQVERSNSLRTFATLVPYLWPVKRPDLKARVVIALFSLVLANCIGPMRGLLQLSCFSVELIAIAPALALLFAAIGNAREESTPSGRLLAIVTPALWIGAIAVYCGLLCRLLVEANGT